MPRARPLSTRESRRFGLPSMRLPALAAAIAFIPLCVAWRGAPRLWELLFLVSLTLPFASVLLLTRGGKFRMAPVVSCGGLLGAAAAIACGNGGLSAASLVWLILVPFEAVFTLSMPFVLVATGAAALTVGGIGAATALGWAPHAIQGSVLYNMAFVAPALVYGASIATETIRARREREAHARIGSARYDTLAHAMGDLMLRMDRTGAVVFAGPECEQLFGLNPRELMGRGLFERILVAERPAFLSAIADACVKSETVRCVLRFRGQSAPEQNGTYDEPVFVWIEMRARRITLQGAVATEGDGACVLALLRDVSAEKRSEEEHERSRHDAERANAWKDRFLANVSHELRTPLNAIIGFSEILGNASLMPADDKKRTEYAGIIHDAGQHLLTVVNTILDMSKIEAGCFELAAESFDLGALADACCDLVSLKAAQSSIELRRLYGARNEPLVADERACKQILINLLSNAIKFTPRGGRVSLAIRQEGATMLIVVADTGIGIQAADLPRLGDAFFQAGSGYTRQHEGTGLGLSVVRGLVGLHGGSMAIESSEGAGTCVSVRLPVDCRTVAGKPSARIEVIPRLGRNHHEFTQPSASPVKKIA